jgi:prophage regulatory protein
MPKSTIYEKIKEGTFPKPLRLGAKSVAWIESEIDAWISECVQRRDAADSHGNRNRRRAGVPSDL